MNRLPTTPAERERIADLLRMGIAHKAIAERLDVSEATVKRVAAERRAAQAERNGAE
jgi:DNA-binding NarL/FixJ family response regulator